MQAPAVIRSRDNPALKRVGAVRAGKAPELVLLEGERLIEDARRAGLEFELVLVSEEREERARELEARGLPVRRAEARLVARASELATSPGVIALARAPHTLAPRELEPAADALGLVVCGVSDPGNLGALARSAEALGCGFVCVVAGGVAPTHPAALRGSMGSLLRLPLARADEAGACYDALAELGFRQVRAATRGGLAPAGFDWSGRVALWVGGETRELPAEALRAEALTLPMAGGVESLNVTVAASLLLACAGRVS